MSTREASSAREHLLLTGALALLFALGALAVFSVDYVHTNDGPQHVASTHLELRYHASAALQQQLDHSPPQTSNGFRLLFLPLDAALGWQRGLQVAQLVMIALWALGFGLLVLAVERRRAWLLPLGFATAFNWAFYMGLWSFYIASAVGAMVLAFSVRTRLKRPRHLLVGATLLLLLAYLHLFVGVLVLGVVGAWSLPGLLRRRRLRRLLQLGLLAAPTVLFVLVFLLRYPVVREGAALRWVLHTPLELLGLFVAGPTWRRLLVLLLMLSAAAAVVHALARRTLRGDDRRIAAAATLLLLFGWLAPLDLPTWQLFSPRFLGLGALLALALLPIERLEAAALGRWRRLAARGAVTLISAACVLWAGSYHLRRSAECANVARALNAPTAPSAARYSVSLDGCGGQPLHHDEEVPLLFPLQQLDALAALYQGGVPYTFFAGEPGIHAFSYRGGGRLLRPASSKRHELQVYRTQHPLEGRPLSPYEESLLAYLATPAVWAGSVTLVGHHDQDQGWLVRRGFRADYAADGVFVGHFAGCPIRVRVSPLSGVQTLRVQHGLFPLDHPVEDLGLAVPRGAAEETVEIFRLACEGVWLRIWSDEDDDGALDPQEPRCAYSDASGRNLLEHPAQTPHVACELRRPGASAGDEAGSAGAGGP